MTLHKNSALISNSFLRQSFYFVDFSSGLVAAGLTHAQLDPWDMSPVTSALIIDLSSIEAAAGQETPSWNRVFDLVTINLF